VDHRRRIKIPLIQRIELDGQTGCWNWRGAHLEKGYGIVRYKDRDIGAHRLSAHLWLGMRLDDPRMVMHKCDNPRCFNPKHLKIGTALENVRDCRDKKRFAAQKRTHCPRGHSLSGNNLMPSRLKRGHRGCLICNREQTIEWRHRKKEISQ
jgi:HNH endonuclease